MKYKHEEKKEHKKEHKHEGKHKKMPHKGHKHKAKGMSHVHASMIDEHQKRKSK